MDGPTLRLLDGPSNLSIDGGCGDPDLLSVGRWLPDRRAEHTDRSGTRQQLRTAGAGSSGADLIAGRRRGVKGSRGRAAILETQIKTSNLLTPTQRQARKRCPELPWADLAIGSTPGRPRVRSWSGVASLAKTPCTSERTRETCGSTRWTRNRLDGLSLEYISQVHSMGLP